MPLRARVRGRARAARVGAERVAGRAGQVAGAAGEAVDAACRRSALAAAAVAGGRRSAGARLLRAPAGAAGGAERVAARGADVGVLACPILDASGEDEPAGWLGAAAATTLCERARLILGGRAERTLVPAELLGLPRLPADGFPADPFGAPDARDQRGRRRAAARRSGQTAR